MLSDDEHTIISATTTNSYDGLLYIFQSIISANPDTNHPRGYYFALVPEAPLTPSEVKDLPVRSTELEDGRVGVG